MLNHIMREIYLLSSKKKKKVSLQTMNAAYLSVS